MEEDEFLGIISGDNLDLVGAREDIENGAREYNISVCDLPMIIQAMDRFNRIREGIVGGLIYLDILSFEVHGKRDSNYER